MGFKDTLKQLFRYTKNRNDISLFKDHTKDMYNLPFDEYTKKYTKAFETDIKNIPSLSKEEKEKKYAEMRHGLKLFKDAKLSSKVNIIEDLGKKYDFTYSYIEKYRDELKKALSE